MKKNLNYLLIICCFSFFPLVTHASHPCSLSYVSQQAYYLMKCGKIEKKYPLPANQNAGEAYQKLKTDYLAHSRNKLADETELRDRVLRHFENELRFQFSGDQWLMNDLLQKFASLSALPHEEECDEYITEKKEVAPFVDLSIPSSEQSEIVRLMADEKMAEDGFFNLGRLQSMSIDLQTENDNLLHGALQKFGMDKKQGIPDWEGDDRGYTFGESLELNFKFADGHIKGKQYTEGHSSLASVIKKVEVCDKSGKCSEKEVAVKRDAENKRYQTFLTIDGIELELRRNHINGDIYVKMGTSVEHLTDTPKGLAQTLQTSWHKLQAERGIVQYHNLDHMKDRWRAQVNTGIGIEKKHDVTNWLSLKGAVEGNIQASSDGLTNSYVSVRTEVSVDSNQLLRKNNSNQTPLLEAKLYAESKYYGDNNNYVNIGVTLHGTLYSDNSGNILSLYAGAEQLDSPEIRKYGIAEFKNKQRADLNHIAGIKYQKKF